jgi:hypothetical protein
MKYKRRKVNSTKNDNSQEINVKAESKPSPKEEDY